MDGQVNDSSEFEVEAAVRTGLCDAKQKNADLAQAQCLVDEWTTARSKRLTELQSQNDLYRPASEQELLESALKLVIERGIERVRLYYLRQSIEIGSVRSLRYRIGCWDAFLSASSNEAIRTEFSDMKSRLEDMAKIEAAHGVGALLNLDHPIVRSLSNRSDSWIGPNEIHAAKRYQGLAVDV